MRKTLAVFFAALPLFACAPPAAAQELSYVDTIFRAEVASITSSGVRAVQATRISTEYQELSMRIIGGPREGELIPVSNDSSVLLAPGDVAYVRVLALSDGGEAWVMVEPDRRGVLFALAALFVAVTAMVGGMAGLRSLAALAGSFAIILFALVPLLYAGAPPVATSLALSVAILAFSMVVTHKIRRHTLVAFAGSVVALAFAAFVAQVSVALAQMSGFVSDEVTYLNFQTGGTLDLSGLLLGSILIGVVGVLNDISVSQVHTVAELHEANPALSRREVLAKAMRVGKEHLGAVVNTLPLAYAGAALPLLMFFSTTDAPFLYVINREVFASEAIRVLAGGIALSLSGAIATVLAAFFLVRPRA